LSHFRFLWPGRVGASPHVSRENKGSSPRCAAPHLMSALETALHLGAWQGQKPAVSIACMDQGAHLR
jgi:hypothetical protein